MRFLPTGELAREIATQGLGEEISMGLYPDGDQPGQHDRQQHRETGNGARGAQPRPVTIPERQHQRGEYADARRDRTFDENADADGGPSGKGDGPGQFGPPRIAGGEIGAQQHGLCRHHGCKQHRIGRGDGGFGGEQQRARQQCRGRERRWRRRHRAREPEGQPRRGKAAEKRWQAIGPDMAAIAQARDGG